MDPVAQPAQQNGAHEGTFLFLSRLLGRRVSGADGRRLGTLVDVVADTGEGVYPRVRALRVRVSLTGDLRRVEWEDVASCDEHGTQLKRGAEALGPLKQ